MVKRLSCMLCCVVAEKGERKKGEKSEKSKRSRGVYFDPGRKDRILMYHPKIIRAINPKAPTIV